MAETSLEQSYQLSHAELIFPLSNTPSLENSYCSIEDEFASIPVEIIYCQVYKKPSDSICTIGILFDKKPPQSYPNALTVIPVNDASGSLQKNGSPLLKTEKQDSSNSIPENTHWLMSYIKTISNSEALPITIATGSLGVALYYTSAGLPYLLSGTGIGAIALIASLYLDSTFINSLGIEVVKYSAMKFFANSIEDRIIPHGHFMLAAIATVAASGITTTWIILESKIIARWDSNISVDRIPYAELLPAVFTKRIIQDTVTIQLPNIIELVPYVSKDLKCIKIIADFCGLFTGGVVKDTIYDYREVKNYTQAEIYGRQFASAFSKMLPGWVYFDGLIDKTHALFTFEWLTKAISRNIGKISFESISAYFNPKPFNTTLPLHEIKQPNIAKPIKSTSCSEYQLTSLEVDNDSHSKKM